MSSLVSGDPQERFKFVPHDRRQRSMNESAADRKHDLGEHGGGVVRVHARHYRAGVKPWTAAIHSRYRLTRVCPVSSPSRLFSGPRSAIVNELMPASAPP